MRHNLKKPCKNCPFADRETRIVFQGKERAAEIEEQAYRYGFPCHLSAELVEDDEGEGGYVPGAKTQHCAGAIGMHLNAGYTEGPGVGNKEPPGDYGPAQAVAFPTVEAFIDANANPRFDEVTE